MVLVSAAAFPLYHSSSPFLSFSPASCFLPLFMFVSTSLRQLQRENEMGGRRMLLGDGCCVTGGVGHREGGWLQESSEVLLWQPGFHAVTPLLCVADFSMRVCVCVGRITSIWGGMQHTHTQCSVANIFWQSRARKIEMKFRMCSALKGHLCHLKHSATCWEQRKHNFSGNFKTNLRSLN